MLKAMKTVLSIEKWYEVEETILTFLPITGAIYEYVMKNGRLFECVPAKSGMAHVIATSQVGPNFVYVSVIFMLAKTTSTLLSPLGHCFRTESGPAAIDWYYNSKMS